MWHIKTRAFQAKPKYNSHKKIQKEKVNIAVTVKTRYTHPYGTMHSKIRNDVFNSKKKMLRTMRMVCVSVS